jgi:hypothetical protein
MTETAELALLAEQSGVRLVTRKAPPTCSDWWDDVRAGIASSGPLLAILIAPSSPGGEATVLTSIDGNPERQALAVRQALQTYRDDPEPAWQVRGDGLRYLTFQR